MLASSVKRWNLQWDYYFFTLFIVVGRPQDYHIDFFFSLRLFFSLFNLFQPCLMKKASCMCKIVILCDVYSWLNKMWPYYTQTLWEVTSSMRCAYEEWGLWCLALFFLLRAFDLLQGFATFVFLCILCNGTVFVTFARAHTSDQVVRAYIPSTWWVSQCCTSVASPKRVYYICSAY